MDPKTKIEYLDLLAREVNSKSTHFEPFTSSSNSTVEAMHLLSQLEGVTEVSLESIKKTVVTAPTNQPPQVQKTAVASNSGSLHYSSNHPEYRPALQNPGVLQALLSLRQKRAESKASIQISKKP